MKYTLLEIITALVITWTVLATFFGWYLIHSRKKLRERIRKIEFPYENERDES